MAAAALASLPSGRRVALNDGFDRYHDDTDPQYLVFNDPADADGNGMYGIWVDNGVAEMQDNAMVGSTHSPLLLPILVKLIYSLAMTNGITCGWSIRQTMIRYNT